MVYLAVLLIGIVTLVAWARLTDRPLLAQPLALPLTSERVMHITADLDGAAHITDERAKLIAKYAPGEAVFISTIVRVVRRERQKIDANLDAPIHLRRRGETRLTIFDPETQRETELSSFGKDNVASFAALLDMPAR
ncbi:MAG: photosynthetic complex assembly protein PuhC [Pseudomonadota bacterium]